MADFLLPFLLLPPPLPVGMLGKCMGHRKINRRTDSSRTHTHTHTQTRMQMYFHNSQSLYVDYKHTLTLTLSHIHTETQGARISRHSLENYQSKRCQIKIMKKQQSVEGRWDGGHWLGSVGPASGPTVLMPAATPAHLTSSTAHFYFISISFSFTFLFSHSHSHSQSSIFDLINIINNNSKWCCLFLCFVCSIPFDAVCTFILLAMM